MSLKSATELHVECIKKYGVEYVNWDPQIVRDDEEYDEEDLDKIQAICTLISTDQYYTKMETFFFISRVLNQKPPSFEVLYPLDAPLITWSIIEAKINDKDFGTFNDEVLGYIKACFQYYGVPHMPKQLKGILNFDYPDTPDTEFDTDIDYYIKEQLKKIPS